ncbi:pre-mRNA cleavage complex II Clp1-like,conserved, putative [Trypanosoma brucei gambiense DAL972]|uniref:Pre-mRNA cleavage complex II Clp1-like, conserved n=3 Tax=Trypanosoma brucei TaxID=5691 RepID=Q585W7_TRYB2|nr:pre-mRNA cleavage complex II Clp1-like,conserved, putative [Trypanosoma brucei gambiense DAL972]XP_845487.1 pre-mRNA cleavage complex II Clp1-like, conserved [Trypanosoma brucei brucei TREU927]AAX80784.1 pre-mRNA cleavage complex II Clp1-like, conserved [Trypanosoma brucei]RHW72045.1 pre-mRNA cleavage complex II Clp1-like [Trypanosoma brucei equiperdum]AAZ11928.1 pre-mRNA cleavage complex II Clp1-like, conserved [Trypanosoma brucei brucei TREU927]CBH11868.1 pre-mRNA cleavage complex II Clp1|eukprot:XP_011774153.1 pre-mRNA cleavage complex II Clp1-like,conserved, putative [Trypanosoma brucei gambiense DAL972]
MSSNCRTEEFNLERKELKIRFRSSGYVVLTDGAATIFGAPLKKNTRYDFSMCSIPVVSPVACRLHVGGDFTSVVTYIRTDVYDIHAVLDFARHEASKRGVPSLNDTNPGGTSSNSLKEGPWGPRVLVVGDVNTGKSSLCRSLANMAVASQVHGVALVDVDVGQQGITCPGSVATAFVDNYLPIDEGFNTVMPLTAFFGDKTVNASTRGRYLDLCASLARGIISFSLATPKFAAGGVIVNTMGWVTDMGLDLLFQLLSVFSITHVVVCGSGNKLTETLRNAVIDEKIIFLKYPKQTGVFKRKGNVRDSWRAEQIVSYFQGTKRTPLLSYRAVCYVKDVHFIHALKLEPLSWKDVEPLSLAAVSWTDSLEAVNDINVAGFIVLLEVGETFFSFLSPVAGTLPKPFILVSPTIRLPRDKVPPLQAP